MWTCLASASRFFLISAGTAEALSARPGLLLADEPTTDLNEEGLRLLRKQLTGFSGALRLVSHDRALLFVSHDEEFIRKTATRVIRFEGEKLVTTEDVVGIGQRSKDAANNPADSAIEISKLEMRMAALSARMAALIRD